ncbi:MAG TPA: DUF4870 domain-containing protein [Anaerolineaceae bacterium]|jgi:uncharacterized membrane protein
MAQQFGAPTDVTSDDKLWALLTYIFSPIVPIIILLMEDKKNRPFIRAHNAQALAWGVIIYVLSFILTFVVIGPCVGLLGLVVNIYWGIQAYQGKYVTIPVITNFVKQQGWA